MQKYLFVIPEVVIGNPVSLKNKAFWIPVFTGMTTQVILQGLLQEPRIVFIAVVLIGLGAGLYFYLSEKKHTHHH
ncbi:MAG: hypothetical protein C4560_11260 [Nitrospiraceae bacterium]|nr:MAG: hypothetical protein C4560_11260 [Nitrospiraceae bacterium]